MVKSRENLVGAYAFLVGVILAVVFGLFNDRLSGMSESFYSVLVLIGLIVGFMNTSERDMQSFCWLVCRL